METSLGEIVKVNYDSGNPMILGRNLHEALEIDSNYTTWFKRMCEYGFIEGKDYSTCFPNLESENQHGGQNKTDHEISLDMAKEICMIQRSKKGKAFREYFIQIEKAWNDPVLVMSRAYEAQKAIADRLSAQVLQLVGTVAVQTQQIAELKPKASYYDLVLNCKDLLSVTEIAKDYGKSAKWLNEWLREHGVQFRQGKIWILYAKYAEQGYTSTKTQPFTSSDGEIHTKIHTYWTQKGRLFLYDLLKEYRILPLIEREADEA